MVHYRKVPGIYFVVGGGGGVLTIKLASTCDKTSQTFFLCILQP